MATRAALGGNRLGLGRLGGLGEALVLAYTLPVFAVLFSRGDVALHRMGLWLGRPTVTFFLLLSPLLLPILLREVPARFRGIREVVRGNALLLVPMAFMAALGLVGSALPGSYWGDGGKFILFPFYNLLVLLVAMLLPMLPVIRRHVGLLALAAWVILLGTMISDLIVPGLFAKHVARPAGLAENANESAFLLLVACCLLFGAARSRVSQVLILLLTGGGVLVTLSRGGIATFLLLLMAVGGVALLDRRKGTRGHLLAPALALAGAILGVLLGLVLVRQEVGIFSRPGVQQRVRSISQGDLISDSDSRLALIAEAVEYIGVKPLIGHGTGFANGLPKGPHNRFLLEWMNLGLPGLFSLLAFIGGAALHFYRHRSLAGMLLIVPLVAHGMLCHSLMESRGLLLALGLTATMSLPAFRAPAAKIRGEAS